MSGCLKVKGFLLKEGVESAEGVEIRRFRLEEDGGDRYRCLLNRVLSAFSIDTSTHHCVLAWKDDDDDLVQFSTTEELCLALDNMEDDTFRVYVTLFPKTAGNAMETSPEAGTCVKQGHVSFAIPLQRTHSFPGRMCGKNRKMMKKLDKVQHKMECRKNKEFCEIREQVPAEFRRWVRQYVHTWFTQGADAVAKMDKVPDGVDLHFPQWLHRFLENYRHRLQMHTEGENGEMVMGGEEGEMLPAPEGLSPMYYRWLCLFVPRFFWRQHNGTAVTSDCETGKGSNMKDGFSEEKEGDHCHRKCERRGGRHGKHESASESEDSDNEQSWKKVPKEFRKYARISMKHLYKNKGDHSKIKEKATEAGLSPAVQEFVDQIVLEWHAKLSTKGPGLVAKEIEEVERNLPAGLEKDHFQWLCRFMARWHRRHAGKCDAVSGWSSGETTDDTSGDEAIGEQGFRSWAHENRHQLRAAMKMMRRYKHAMMGQPCSHPFPMHPGMRHPCFPPPPPACWAKRYCKNVGGWYGMQHNEEDGAACSEFNFPQNDTGVECATEGKQKV